MIILITAYLNEFNSQYRNYNEILALQKDYHLRVLKNMIHLHIYKKAVVLHNNMHFQKLLEYYRNDLN
jgi:hypothetical protein